MQGAFFVKNRHYQGFIRRIFVFVSVQKILRELTFFAIIEPKQVFFFLVLHT
jgi:hypothetical protein